MKKLLNIYKERIMRDYRKELIQALEEGLPKPSSAKIFDLDFGDLLDHREMTFFREKLIGKVVLFPLFTQEHVGAWQDLESFFKEKPSISISATKAVHVEIRWLAKIN
jgi:hypothetical protein